MYMNCLGWYQVQRKLSISCNYYYFTATNYNVGPLWDNLHTSLLTSRSSYFLCFKKSKRIWEENSNILLLNPTFLNYYSTYYLNLEKLILMFSVMPKETGGMDGSFLPLYLPIMHSSVVLCLEHRNCLLTVYYGCDDEKDVGNKTD